MNLSRREIEPKENGNANHERDLEKREGAVKRTLRNGEKLLVATVLSAGLAFGCGSAGPNSKKDSGTDGTGGVLPGIEDTRTSDSASDLVDEDIIEDSEPGDVPVETDVDEDVIEDSSEESDAVSDVPEDMEDADAVEDSAEDSKEDVSVDADLDAEWDVEEDVVGDTIDVDGDTLDAIDADTLDMDTFDVTDSGGDIIGDVDLDGIDAEVDAGDVVGDMVGEDVAGEDAALVCMPYDDSVTGAWTATGTVTLVGGVYVMYNGMDHSGNGLYDIICGGTILRSDIPVAVGATVTVDVLEMGFRVAIEANSVSGLGANSDIEVSTISSAICSASDASRLASIHAGSTTIIGGVGVRYNGTDTSGNAVFDLLCEGTVVRSDIHIAPGATETLHVSEQYFTITLNPRWVSSSGTGVGIDIDSH